MREFGGNDYTAAQIESCLRYIVSVDPNLIADRTYFVAEIDGALVGCGGWTHRAPGFRTSALMRAIFVDPDWARRGIASRIMAFLEACAREAGNRQAALVATLCRQGNLSTIYPVQSVHNLSGSDRLKPLSRLREREGPASFSSWEGEG